MIKCAYCHTYQKEGETHCHSCCAPLEYNSTVNVSNRPRTIMALHGEIMKANHIYGEKLYQHATVTTFE